MSAGRVMVLVTAPLVLARDDDGSIGYYYRGPAPVSLTAAEAHRLAGDGLVQLVAGEPALAEPTAEPAADTPPAPSVDDLALVDDQDDDEPEPEPAPEPPAKRPAQVADKSEWIEYAVAVRGLDREYAESRTKRELIAELQ